MGHLFRINQQGASVIVDWSTTASTPYDSASVAKISDTTTTQKEITSIPSPFARIELVKEAFRKVAGQSISGLSVAEVAARLHGNSIYHKMVSDSLDVGQIFFNYPSMKDKVDIVVWDKKQQLQLLLSSNNPAHQNVGKTLDMFFDQDAKGNDPYNFGKMQNLYILKYKGIGQRQMHIIGATSPATLFFSTANDESSISKQLCFGTDYAFDNAYASLDQRDKEYIKYLFTFKYSNPNFAIWYPEVDAYLDAVYFILDNNLKNEINNIQSSINQQTTGSIPYIDSQYSQILFSVNQAIEYQVEINGQCLHYKNTRVQGNSSFQIKCSKQIKGFAPLVLPITNSNAYENLTYYGSEFGKNFKVPAYDSHPLNLRQLPGIGVQYPYLTISDFLEDKIFQLPSEVNKDDFFDGNYNDTLSKKWGFLLPVTHLYFDYFTIEDLKGTTPSGKKTIEIKTIASGVEVTLRIPIQNNNEVEYKRIYTLDIAADKENNKGAIVPSSWDFDLGIIPPIQFANPSEAHYRIVIISDFEINKGCSCCCHNDTDGFFVPDYVVRNVDVVSDVRSKVYNISNKTFDCIRFNVITDEPSKEKKATGILVPFFKKRTGTTKFTFAIDLGTSNTHIEYISGPGEMPKPFEFDSNERQMSLVCKPSDLIKNHIRGEFIPEAIGSKEQCHFPLRTVLCIDKVNSGINESNVGAYTSFGNASPAFMYNKSDVGTGYNQFIPDLKWSALSNENEERIRCFIESLFMMIRAKVILEGGSLSQTQIKWFYPISMSNHKKGLFERLWSEAYHKYFNPDNNPISITESIAPYSFFQKTKAEVTNIVTIDIGGGTTDIVVATTNAVKLITSVRFAANAIFGNSLVPINNGALNGIIKQFKSYFLENLKGLDDLKKMLETKTANNYGNSNEVASFLFSLADNEQVRNKGIQDKLDFNAVLSKDNSQKIVFYIFYTSIIYHLANLMKAKGIEVPANIAFSGNGSKIISVLGSKGSLESLTAKMFETVYGDDISKINLIINEKNPKEATCKGGLFLDNIPDSVSNAKEILLGNISSVLVTDQTYSTVSNHYDDVVKEIKRYLDVILLKLPKKLSLSNEFGIDQKYVKIAIQCFNKDLRPYIEKGVNLKLSSKDVNPEDIIEETLFFYPIIGVINDLSDLICADVNSDNHTPYTTLAIRENGVK